MLRIDFWPATGFTLRDGKGGPIFSLWVVVSLIESKGFHYQPARPPSRLLSSWKPGKTCLFRCAAAATVWDNREPDRVEYAHRCMAWRRAAVL